MPERRFCTDCYGLTGELSFVLLFILAALIIGGIYLVFKYDRHLVKRSSKLRLPFFVAVGLFLGTTVVVGFLGFQLWILEAQDDWVPRFWHKAGRTEVFQGQGDGRVGIEVFLIGYSDDMEHHFSPAIAYQVSLKEGSYVIMEDQREIVTEVRSDSPNFAGKGVIELTRTGSYIFKIKSDGIWDVVLTQPFDRADELTDFKNEEIWLDKERENLGE